MGKPNIIYKLLTNEMIPRFVQAYTLFYRETEGEDMPAQYLQNWLALTMLQMKNPEAFNLCACSGKKVVGFAIITSMPSMDGVKSAFIDAFFVLPEYRNLGIAKMLFSLSDGWMGKKGYKYSYAVEKPDSDIWSKKKHLGFKPYRKLLVRTVKQGGNNGN